MTCRMPELSDSLEQVILKPAHMILNYKDWISIGREVRLMVTKEYQLLGFMPVTPTDRFVELASRVHPTVKNFQLIQPNQAKNKILQTDIWVRFPLLESDDELMLPRLEESGIHQSCLELVFWTVPDSFDPVNDSLPPADEVDEDIIAETRYYMFWMCAPSFNRSTPPKSLEVYLCLANTAYDRILMIDIKLSLERSLMKRMVHRWKRFLVVRKFQQKRLHRVLKRHGIYEKLLKKLYSKGGRIYQRYAADEGLTALVPKIRTHRDLSSLVRGSKDSTIILVREESYVVNLFENLKGFMLTPELAQLFGVLLKPTLPQARYFRRFFPFMGLFATSLVQTGYYDRHYKDTKNRPYHVTFTNHGAYLAISAHDHCKFSVKYLQRPSYNHYLFIAFGVLRTYCLSDKPELALLIGDSRRKTLRLVSIDRVISRPYWDRWRAFVLKKRAQVPPTLKRKHQ